MKRTKLFSLLMAAGLGLGLAQSAQAIVISWSYVNDDGFTDWTPAAGIIATDNSVGRILPAVAGTATNLSWGVGSPVATNNSSLDIGTGHIAGSVMTGGGPVNGVTLTHNNFPITGTSLVTAELTSSLRLTALDAPGGDYFPAGDPIAFMIKFIETPNGAATCANGGANGSGVNINGCADILVLDNPSVLTTFLTVGGQTYKVTINPDSNNAFKTLSNAACDAAGAANGCQGWETIENQANVLRPQFSIVAVPEPATLALLGLGLVGLGAMRRRKQA